MACCIAAFLQELRRAFRAGSVLYAVDETTMTFYPFRKGMNADGNRMGRPLTNDYLLHSAVLFAVNASLESVAENHPGYCQV